MTHRRNLSPRLRPAHRFLAAGLATVVWLLGLFAVAPHWHGYLHGHAPTHAGDHAHHGCNHDHGHSTPDHAPAPADSDHGCAITDFAHGVTPALAFTATPPAPASRALVRPDAVTVALHRDPWRLPPGRAPPLV
jgi:hypothetical protein